MSGHNRNNYRRLVWGRVERAELESGPLPYCGHTMVKACMETVPESKKPREARSEQFVAALPRDLEKQEGKHSDDKSQTIAR